MSVVKINAIEVPPGRGDELEASTSTAGPTTTTAWALPNPVATGASLLEFEVVTVSTGY